jgi:hypothetical protein
MRTRAVGLALKKGRATTGSGALDRFACRVCHRAHVIAIHLDAGDAIRRAARGDTWIVRGILKRNLGGELIIFADEHRGQPPDARQVQSFVERAVVHRAIAEEGDRHAIGLEQLEAVARARRLKNARADDAAGAHEPNLRREEMHRATASARATGLASEQFGHQLDRRQPFGQRVAMSAMRAEDHVLPAQRRADPDRHRFLADVGVTRAMNQPALVTARQLLFRLADELHLSVKPDG